MHLHLAIPATGRSCQPAARACLFCPPQQREGEERGGRQLEACAWRDASVEPVEFGKYARERLQEGTKYRRIIVSLYFRIFVILYLSISRDERRCSPKYTLYSVLESRGHPHVSRQSGLPFSFFRLSFFPFSRGFIAGARSVTSRFCIQIRTVYLL